MSNGTQMNLTVKQLHLITTGTITNKISKIEIDKKELVSITNYNNGKDFHFYNNCRINLEKYYDLYWTQSMLQMEYGFNTTEILTFTSPAGTISLKYYRGSLESIERIHYNSDQVLVSDQTTIQEVK